MNRKQKNNREINETKSCLPEINKIEECLSRIIREKKKKTEKTKISNIRNDRGDCTLNSTDIKRIKRKYYEQLYANKFNNLDKMEQFFQYTN